MSHIPEMFFQFLLVGEAPRDMLATDENPPIIFIKPRYQITVRFDCGILLCLRDSFEEFARLS